VPTAPGFSMFSSVWLSIPTLGCRGILIFTFIVMKLLLLRKLGTLKVEGYYQNSPPQSHFHPYSGPLFVIMDPFCRLKRFPAEFLASGV